MIRLESLTGLHDRSGFDSVAQDLPTTAGRRLSRQVPVTRLSSCTV